MIITSELEHESLKIGAAPIVRHFMKRLRLEEYFAEAVDANDTGPGRPCTVPDSRTLSLLVANILMTRTPLYGVADWARPYVPDNLPIEAGDLDCVNDDRLGRSLAKLHAANTPSLLRKIAARAIEEFGLDMTQIHNDSTSITLSGQYRNQKSPGASQEAPRITFGLNKDFRPDLKQLVYALTITADGAVPIHFRVYDGNTTDDRTHHDTWAFVRELIGSSDFMYIADCKLGSKENLHSISEKGGTFITVLPRTRTECKEFYRELETKRPRWKVIFPWGKEQDQDGVGDEDAEPEYKTLVRERNTADGYRLVWFWSASKAVIDRDIREARIKKALPQLARSESAHSRSLDATKKQAEDAVRGILKATRTGKYLTVNVTVGHYKLANGERRRRFIFDVEKNQSAIKAAGKTDGIFPLVTNHSELNAGEVLHLYKFQPFIEKRFEQVKSVLNVPPVFLKRPDRVAGLLFITGVALLVFALIERALRDAMSNANIESLPLYHEQRLCKAPTTNVIFETVEDARRHRLRSEDGTVLRTFHDKISPVALQVLQLLGVDLRHYGLAKDDRDGTSANRG